VAVIWMLDTNTLIYFVNRGPHFDRVARRMSGKSPGELRMSAITLCELRFGIAASARTRENEALLEARHLGATLITNNEREFRRVPGLAVRNWLRS